MNILKLDDIVRRKYVENNTFRFYYNYYEPHNDITSYVAVQEKIILLDKHYQKNYDEGILYDLIKKLESKKNHLFFFNSDIGYKSILDIENIVEHIRKCFFQLGFNIHPYSNIIGRTVIIGRDKY